MANLFIKYYKPQYEQMQTGDRYILQFEVTHRKPDDNFIELPNQTFFLQISGIDSRWTEELRQPVKPGSIEIRLKPPANLKREKIHFKVNVIDEQGDIFDLLYSKKIEIVNSNQADNNNFHDTEVSPSEFSEEIQTIYFRLAKDLPDNFGILYATCDSQKLLLHGTRGSGKLLTSSPMQFNNPDQLSLDSFVKSNNPFDKLFGLGKNLFHSLDPNIINWILELLKTQPSPKLLICDVSDFEIPWELIYIDKEDSDFNGFLGAVVSLARW